MHAGVNELKLAVGRAVLCPAVGQPAALAGQGVLLGVVVAGVPVEELVDPLVAGPDEADARVGRHRAHVDRGDFEAVGVT